MSRICKSGKEKALARQLTDRAMAERLPPWGVLILESHHSPQFEMEWRTHAFLKIVYVLKGEGTFHLGNDSEGFSGGDVIVVPPGVRNRIEDDPASAASLYICCVDPALLGFDPSLAVRLETRVFRRNGHFANRVASILRRMVHTQQTASLSRPASMVADALRLVVAVDRRARQSVVSDRGISDERRIVREYVESLPGHFFDETSIDAAASQLGLRRRTFTKLFGEVTGETWLNHIRRLAIEHAQRRLRQSDLPISSIAFECGFNDLSTFYRQFKKQCGVAPGEFRSSTDPVKGVGGSEQDGIIDDGK